ncbi:hypothetical protein [Luteipulveratus halotolerans]|uniref:Uncharacterized protein n=1 Tax=Luteipulveratus halotolerans TaxID=1631356 RepID=A0A0L6CM91_9MICO|nr:hypothetical protein [Luteipulveratus halotolerans]KNX38849.1 hypothetical protein VV01_19665 [Luteipulveratus halotolerans]
MGGRHLTRDQVFTWVGEWSVADHRTIAEHLDRVGAVSYSVPASGGYIRCADADDRMVMRIAPGYVEFATATAPDDLKDSEWRGFTLSTFRERRSPELAYDEPPQVCPVHFVTLPASGVCDDCG